MSRPNMPIHYSTKQESGAALIIALLVVALVTAIATEMTSDYLITVKRASNQVISEQSYSYLRAAEEMAKKVLRDDILLNEATDAIQDAINRAKGKDGQDNQNNTEEMVDNCDDPWAFEWPPYSVPNGIYSGKIHDLQGRFNLNALKLDADGKPTNVPTGVHQHRFMRLLQSFENIEVSFDEAQAVTQALLDYLDADSEVEGFGGAEESYYEDLENRKPHRPANRTLVDTSELLLVAHLRPKLYKALIPHITVWPQDVGAIAININTATANVLRSLNVPGGPNPVSTPAPGKSSSGKKSGSGKTSGRTPGNSDYGPPLTEEEVKPLLLAQFTGGFATVDDFKSACNDAGGAGVKCNTKGLSINSSYFKLNAEASIGDLTTRLYSVLKRTMNQDTKMVKVQVINRSISGSSVIESCVPPIDEDDPDGGSKLDMLNKFMGG